MKLMQAITNKLSQTSAAAGLEAVAGAEGFRFHLVLLKKRRGKILIVSKQENILSVPALLQQVKPGVPVYLALSGRGLLHKKITAAPSDDARTLLPKMLPNASPNDFYVQRAEGLNGQTFVSVARRSAVEALLEELKALDVVSCALGGIPVSGVVSLLGKNEHPFDLDAGGQRLTFVEGKLGEMQNSEASSPGIFSLGGEALPQPLLTAFAAGFAHFTGQHIAAEIDILKERAEAFRQKRLLKMSAMALLSVVLLLLLGNYFAFQHYWEKKAKLETQLALNGGELQRYQTLQRTLAEKQSFLEKSGLQQASKTSFFADQLALDLPAAITLTRLNITPRQQLSSSDSIAFRPSLIQVEGLCRQSLELNTWITQLKEKGWIKNVSLQSYNQDKAREHGEFMLQLDLK